VDDVAFNDNDDTFIGLGVAVDVFFVLVELKREALEDVFDVLFRENVVEVMMILYKALKQ
jgi:hypothetical protein